MQHQRTVVVLCTLLLSGLVAACSGDSTSEPRGGTGGTGGIAGAGSGSGGSGGLDGMAGTAGNGSTGTGGTTCEPREDCTQVACPGGAVTTCGDCEDNDGDGCVDDQDPECLGPCDDTEGPVLLTGTPGQSGNQCGADCYFDQGNGSGGGECKWDRRCDPAFPKDGCEYNDNLIGEPNSCPDVQPDGCLEGCGALTPNGCDCFGCCTFPQLEGKYVFLGSYIGNAGSCTLALLDDDEACRECTPAGNCLNTCERCELCLGKTELPADCLDGGGGAGGNGGAGGENGSPGERCPEGQQVCGLPGDDPCPPGAYCLTGCCTEVVVE